ncbi:MAG: MnhB domain-containing protein [candidate division WOR-3 bacterium]
MGRGMTVIVKTIARLVAGFIFLYGLYIILHGHLTPGGGFAGGVIIAGSFILLILAFGSQEMMERASYLFASIFESVGGLLFLLIALLGLVAGFYFFLNLFPKGTPLRLISSGIILPANIAIGIKVGAGLLAVFLALAATKFIMEE